ncbi:MULTISPECIES: cytosine permease [Streptomyces]|uniref:Cytosine or purine or uracil or thiamine or allantoin permease family protein n=1 Tax=Streptomyces venezuelae (strain ATCC 10712 / CBS 650.69 / DSM 40230 / JCM 4526 / NBRC 13096 / PD 04745) TaxID=953739 RepID=F2R589_STRVP|nr:cytosine permease [Streptomyces venezuelae]APE24095.1 cytosine permease [Streptomyces venezuelae]QES01466.1 cytosine permease [Streptomyces venezuelae ATCC 10712]CCA58493.1 Cytosine or purine or uracil or thiamine or allantoin permease family protein [Streptomyces venezuelae ATCC 10712]
MPIEQRGVDTVPEAERTSGPRDLVAILLGSNLCLGVIVFGWLPVSFGLGLWASVTSVVTGTLVGVAVTAPLALVSLRTATNLSTSSGAFFGVRGRLVGSVVGLLLSLGYTALTLWIGGDVMVGTLARLIGLPTGGATHAVVYALLAACTVVGAVYGYRLLLKLSKALAVGMTLLLALGLLAYAGDFTTAAVPDTPYLLGSFWPTWLLSAVAAGLSGPVAFITLLGDYTRYVSPERHSSRSVWRATCLGLLVGLLIPQLFGTFTALAARGSLDYAGPLVDASPAWYLVPLLVAATAGSVGNAGLMLYSMGLDLDAILPRATRARATLVVAAVATAFVFLGHFASDAQSAMTSFVLLLTAIGTPWAVITLIGHLRCGGVYDPEALQVYNRRSRGGIYWFSAGWHPRATASWAIGAAVGLAAVSTPLYEGPLIALTGGIDCSFVLSGIVGGTLYAVLTPNRAPAAGTAAEALVPAE